MRRCGIAGVAITLAVTLPPLLLLVACDGSPTAAAPPPTPCVPPALPSSFNAPAVSLAAVRPAVLDAHDRMLASLVQTQATGELRAALAALAQHLTAGGESTCIALRQALEALGRYEAERPAEGGSLPDRVMIRLVLNLGIAALRS